MTAPDFDRASAARVPTTSPRAVALHGLAGICLLALASGCATTRGAMDARDAMDAAGVTFDPREIAPPVEWIAPFDLPTQPAMTTSVGVPPPYLARVETEPSIEKERKGRTLSPPSDPDLAAALLRFSARAQKERAGADRGSALPRGQRENWELLLSAFDEFLQRPAWQTEKADVLRLRTALEAELSRDARLFGDFPAELVEQLMERSASMAVRLAELKRLHATDEDDREDELLAWPVQPVHITSLFGRRRHPITRKMKVHKGIDLSARKGQPILSAGGGVVVRAGKNSDYGLQVTVKHPSGLQTRYSHLSQILVEVGMQLDEGEVLGLAGRTGRATGVHLHFEVLDGQEFLDPLDHLRQKPEPLPVVSTRS